MRKLALLLVPVVLLLAVPPVASAWNYKLPFRMAENKAKSFTRGMCAENVECVAWGVHCSRITNQVVLCSEAVWNELGYAGAEPGEYIKCTGLERVGIGRGGYVVVRFPGNPRCEVVYEP